MNKATEKELSALHSQVARSLSSSMEQADVSLALLAKYKEELPKDVIKFLEEASIVSPSLLSVATKFLKDNNISCDGDEGGELEMLEQKLKAKRANVTKVSFVDG